MIYYILKKGVDMIYGIFYIQKISQQARDSEGLPPQPESALRKQVSKSESATEQQNLSK
jgi:hypothetical protein